MRPGARGHRDVLSAVVLVVTLIAGLGVGSIVVRYESHIRGAVMPLLPPAPRMGVLFRPWQRIDIRCGYSKSRPSTKWKEEVFSVCVDVNGTSDEMTIRSRTVCRTHIVGTWRFARVVQTVGGRVYLTESECLRAIEDAFTRSLSPFPPTGLTQPPSPWSIPTTPLRPPDLIPKGINRPQ